MRVGFVGLGKMGGQIVAKLLTAGHEVVAYDPNPDAVASSVEMGAEGAASREELVAKIGTHHPIVWLMIPADYVQKEVEAYCKLLPPGGILVDGGNSHFEASIGREKLCAQHKINFTDVGTSGGILGLENGFSMMVGGDKQVFEHIKPLLEVLAAPSARFDYFGPAGSGHYVKMVHNGIEYAMMQAYAEGYDLLKYGPVKDLDLKKVANVWQGGSIVQSTLNELIEKILQENPELEGVSGYVADSGEGRWTFETAKSVDVPMPALEKALDMRHASQKGYSTFATKLLAAMRNKFGGHPINK